MAHVHKLTQNSNSLTSTRAVLRRLYFLKQRVGKHSFEKLGGRALLWGTGWKYKWLCSHTCHHFPLQVITAEHTASSQVGVEEVLSSPFVFQRLCFGHYKTNIQPGNKSGETDKPCLAQSESRLNLLYLQPTVVVFLIQNTDFFLKLCFLQFLFHFSSRISRQPTEAFSSFPPTTNL